MQSEQEDRLGLDNISDYQPKLCRPKSRFWSHEQKDLSINLKNGSNVQKN